MTGVGAVTAAWLEGVVVTNPSYMGAPDGETTELLAHLVDLNRHGDLVTFSSQPACVRRADGAAQRAYVCGWTTHHVAAPLIRQLAGTDLLVLTPTDGNPGIPIPVSLSGNEPVTFAGHRLPDHELNLYRDVLPTGTMRELANAQQIVVIDPVWGRKDYLWSPLKDALDWLTTCAPALARRVHDLYLDTLTDLRDYRDPNPDHNPELWLRWEADDTGCATAILYEGVLHRLSWDTVIGLSDLTHDVQARADAESLPVHLEEYASYVTLITQTGEWPCQPSPSHGVPSSIAEGATRRE